MRLSVLFAALGAVVAIVWALGGVDVVALVLLLTAVGWIIGAVLEGRIDLTDYLGHRHDRRD